MPSSPFVWGACPSARGALTTLWGWQANERLRIHEAQLAMELERSDGLHKQVVELQRQLTELRATHELTELEIERHGAIWRHRYCHDPVRSLA